VPLSTRPAGKAGYHVQRRYEVAKPTYPHIAPYKVQMTAMVTTATASMKPIPRAQDRL
jgi:hypothetical protein